MSVSLCSCIARKSEDRREEIMEIDLMNEALVLLRIHPTWKKQEARRKRIVSTCSSQACHTVQASKKSPVRKGSQHLCVLCQDQAELCQHIRLKDLEELGESTHTRVPTTAAVLW